MLTSLRSHRSPAQKVVDIPSLDLVAAHLQVKHVFPARKTETHEPRPEQAEVALPQEEASLKQEYTGSAPGEARRSTTGARRA